SPLRSKVRRLPVERVNGFTPPADPKFRSNLPRDGVEDGLDPRLEKLLHRHPPGYPLQIANACQTTILDCPLDRLQSLVKMRGSQWPLQPRRHHVGGRQEWRGML